MGLTKQINYLGKDFQAYAAITKMPASKAKTAKTFENENGEIRICMPVLEENVWNGSVVVDVYTDNTKQYVISELRMIFNNVSLPYNNGVVKMEDAYSEIKTSSKLDGWEDVI